MNWKIDIDEDRGNEGLPWALVRTVDMILRAGEAVDEFSSKYSNSQVLIFKDYYAYRGERD